MTSFRQMLSTYKNGNKSMAFLAFKNDPNSNEGVYFESFCKEMDRIILLNNSNPAIL